MNPELRKNVEEFVKANYGENHDIDIDALTQRIEKSIKIGEKQIENGQYMEFDEFERRIKAIPMKK